MSKLKILIPLDGSEKSMDSINWFKKSLSIGDAEVTLLNVMAPHGFMEEVSPSSVQDLIDGSKQILDTAEKELDGYTVNKFSIWGYSADEILKEAKEGSYDMIIMTKSSVKGISRYIGSVTTKVVRDSEVAVIVVPE